jgi:hypothetical protein
MTDDRAVAMHFLPPLFTMSLASIGGKFDLSVEKRKPINS